MSMVVQRKKIFLCALKLIYEVRSIHGFMVSLSDMATIELLYYVGYYYGASKLYRKSRTGLMHLMQYASFVKDLSWLT